jgi:hypothetical protein
MPLAAPAEHAEDLVERQDAVAVRVLAAQAVCQRGQDLLPPGPQKIVLDVCPRESGASSAPGSGSPAGDPTGA